MDDIALANLSGVAALACYSRPADVNRGGGVETWIEDDIAQEHCSVRPLIANMLLEYMARFVYHGDFRRAGENITA